MCPLGWPPDLTRCAPNLVARVTTSHHHYEIISPQRETCVCACRSLCENDKCHMEGLTTMLTPAFSKGTLSPLWQGNLFILPSWMWSHSVSLYFWTRYGRFYSRTGAYRHCYATQSSWLMGKSRLHSLKVNLHLAGHCHHAFRHGFRDSREHAWLEREEVFAMINGWLLQ